MKKTIVTDESRITKITSFKSNLKVDSKRNIIKPRSHFITELFNCIYEKRPLSFVFYCDVIV